MNLWQRKPWACIGGHKSLEPCIVVKQNTCPEVFPGACTLVRGAPFLHITCTVNIVAEHDEGNPPNKVL